MGEYAQLLGGAARHRHLDRGHRAPQLRVRGLVVHAQLPVRVPEREGERARRLQADGRRALPGGRRRTSPAARRWAGSISAISAYSANKDLAFEAASCLVQPDNQVTAATLTAGCPRCARTLYGSKEIEDAYPGFADLIEESIDAAAPRPVTPAYTDVSLAIQRALHPVGNIDPDDVTSVYEDLRDKLDQAVNREGLL